MHVMLLLRREEIEALLDLDLLIEGLEKAMAELSAGSAQIAPRTLVRVPEFEGLLAQMASYVGSLGVLESKLVSVYPRNVAAGIPSHQAVIVVFDPKTGTPTALLDAAYITEVRTAAASAVATKHLSRPDSKTMAILGTGVQAGAHGRAIPRVRGVREIRVAGRSKERAERLASDLRSDGSAEVRVAVDFREAMEGADIVCAATHSPDPVVLREWVASGMHINSVGVNPAGREVDAETVRESLVVVDSVEAALAPPEAAGANDLTWPIRDGVIGEDHIHGEIGQIILGRIPGRRDPAEITLYKSVGVAVQDAAAAALVLEAARRTGAGTEIDI